MHATDSRRLVQVNGARLGRIAPGAERGPLRVWDGRLYVSCVCACVRRSSSRLKKARCPEIFQMRWVPCKHTPVGRIRCGAAGAGRARGGARSPSCLGWRPLRVVLVCVAPPQCSGGQGIAKARRDLSIALTPTQIHASRSKSMWRGRGGPRSRRRAVRTGFGIIVRVRSFACAGQ